MSKDDALRRKIEALTETQRTNMLTSVACALWGDEADYDWSADTTEAIASVFTTEGVTLLKSEVEDEETHGDVLRAFKMFLLNSHIDDNGTDKIECFYEHGHWWARVTLPELADDNSERTYSVVDAEGASAIFGFGFEEV